MFTFRCFRQIKITICIGLIFILCCSCSNRITNENKLPDKPQKELTTTNQKQADNNSIGNELIGIWHASPSIAAGFDNVFFFYKDSKFRLNYSEYDEEKRTLNISGKWSIVEDKLILSITQKTIIVGGELVDASPSATSKYQIENGTIQEKKLEQPEIIEYNLGKIEKAADSPYERKLQIDKKFYWKISDDPDDEYYNKHFTESKDNNDDNKADKNQDSKSKTNNTKQTDNKFKTYVNTKYGFSIKYPDSWTISQEPPAGDGIILDSNQNNDIRVYGGYLLGLPGDSIDTIEIDEAKKNGSNIEEFITDSGIKGYKIFKKSEDKVNIQFIVYGSKIHCNLYADISSAFYKENELLLVELAKSIYLRE